MYMRTLHEKRIPIFSRAGIRLEYLVKTGIFYHENPQAGYEADLLLNNERCGRMTMGYGYAEDGHAQEKVFFEEVDRLLPAWQARNAHAIAYIERKLGRPLAEQDMPFLADVVAHNHMHISGSSRENAYLAAFAAHNLSPAAIDNMSLEGVISAVREEIVKEMTDPTPRSTKFPKLELKLDSVEERIERIRTASLLISLIVDRNIQEKDDFGGLKPTKPSEANLLKQCVQFDIHMSQLIEVLNNEHMALMQTAPNRTPHISAADAHIAELEKALRQDVLAMGQLVSSADDAKKLQEIAEEGYEKRDIRAIADVRFDSDVGPLNKQLASHAPPDAGIISLDGTVSRSEDGSHSLSVRVGDIPLSIPDFFDRGGGRRAGLFPLVGELRDILRQPRIAQEEVASGMRVVVE